MKVALPNVLLLHIIIKFYVEGKYYTAHLYQYFATYIIRVMIVMAINAFSIVLYAFCLPITIITP